jgi:hypothetical protein
VLAVLMRAGKQPTQCRLPSLLGWSKMRFLDECVQPHAGEAPDVLWAMNGDIRFQSFDALEEKPKQLSKNMSA